MQILTYNPYIFFFFFVSFNAFFRFLRGSGTWCAGNRGTLVSPVPLPIDYVCSIYSVKAPKHSQYDSRQVFPPPSKYRPLCLTTLPHDEKGIGVSFCQLRKGWPMGLFPDPPFLITRNFFTNCISGRFLWNRPFSQSDLQPLLPLPPTRDYN